MKYNIEVDTDLLETDMLITITMEGECFIMRDDLDDEDDPDEYPEDPGPDSDDINWYRYDDDELREPLFAIGDHVIVIGSSYGAKVNLGDTGTVVDLREGGNGRIFYMVQIDGDSSPSHQAMAECDLIPEPKASIEAPTPELQSINGFHVGDIVKVKDIHHIEDLHVKGLVGRVQALNPKPTAGQAIGVHFQTAEAPFTNWWVDPRSLELLLSQSEVKEYIGSVH